MAGFLLSTFLRNFFLLGPLTLWCTSTLGTVLTCSTSSGSWFGAYTYARFMETPLAMGIYRQSSVKLPPIKNTSSNNTLHIFHATHNNPGYRKNFPSNLEVHFHSTSSWPARITSTVYTHRRMTIIPQRDSNSGPWTQSERNKWRSRPFSYGTRICLWRYSELICRDPSSIFKYTLGLVLLSENPRSILSKN